MHTSSWRRPYKQMEEASSITWPWKIVTMIGTLCSLSLQLATSRQQFWWWSPRRSANVLLTASAPMSTARTRKNDFVISLERAARPRVRLRLWEDLGKQSSDPGSPPISERNIPVCLKPRQNDGKKWDHVLWLRGSVECRWGVKRERVSEVCKWTRSRHHVMRCRPNAYKRYVTVVVDHYGYCFSFPLKHACTHTHTHTNTPEHRQTRARTHARTHARKHARACMHAHMHANARMRTRTPLGLLPNQDVSDLFSGSIKRPPALHRKKGSYQKRSSYGNMLQWCYCRGSCRNFWQKPRDAYQIKSLSNYFGTI